MARFAAVPAGRIALLVAVVVAALLPAASAAAKKPPHGGGGGGGGAGGGASTTSTYVKNYANVLNGVQYDLTPEDVQATPDGGWIALASTPSATNGVLVAWLLKTSAVGAPQWQKEVGCLAAAPGDYSIGVSLQQTSDGGYVLAGGTIGCGSGDVCPSLSGFTCGLVEKVDRTGAVIWAQAYQAGYFSTVFNQIKQTSDGGYVAVGDATDANQHTGALILKLDSLGNIQWQRELGPTGSKMAYFHAVQQTSDGGYIAAGELLDGTSGSNGLTLLSVLSVKFDAAGNITWQRAFNDVDSTGTVTATEHVNAVLQTSDGGYAIGGDWNTDTSGFPGECCQGAPLLKLTTTGSIDWQKAYSGGVHCYSNGYNTTCYDVGGGVFSLHQSADGGYVLAGDSNRLEFNGLVPWLAKVDSSGALLWQENDYQVNASTGLPLSEYFASSALTPVGPVAIGYTENYSNGRGELLGVQTDASGNVGSCSQIHAASVLTATNPGLAAIAPALTVLTTSASQSPSPAQTAVTTATATLSQC